MHSRRTSPPSRASAAQTRHPSKGGDLYDGSRIGAASPLVRDDEEARKETISLRLKSNTKNRGTQ
jgi:hypothetical protein